MKLRNIVYILQRKKTYLEVKVHAFLNLETLGENVLFFHVICQRVVAVSCVTLREEDGVVEAHELAASHFLLVITNVFMVTPRLCTEHFAE